MKLINPLIIIRILSSILFIETFAFLICLPVVYIYNESAAPFLLSALITTCLAVVCILISQGADTAKFSNRDGFLSVTISWVMFSLLGALPYMLSGYIPSFVDAFFESTSGFSTTGSSVLNNVEILPFSILFWRSLTHWIGGIGMIVILVIVLPSIKATSYQLFSLESGIKEKIHAKTSGIIYRVMFIYLGLTLAQIILLMAGDMNFFDSVCHSFGTVATGGFSTKNNNLAYFSSYSQYIVMFFMLLAGTSQVIYYYIIKLNFKKVKQNEELWFYLAVVMTMGTLTTMILHITSTSTFEESFRSGFFQVISIVSCTGFRTTDYLLWPGAAILLMFLLMFAGASTGSTGGGIRMGRHLIVIKNIKNIFVKLNHPNSISSIKLNGKSLSEKTNISILSFVVLYLFIFVIGTVMVVISGVEPITASSSVATCMAGIGPGLGSVGPMSNFSGMPETAKIILSLLMIIGRLEIITVFTIFTRVFWKL